MCQSDISGVIATTPLPLGANHLHSDFYMHNGLECVSRGVDDPTFQSYKIPNIHWPSELYLIDLRIVDVYEKVMYGVGGRRAGGAILLARLCVYL